MDGVRSGSRTDRSKVHGVPSQVPAEVDLHARDLGVVEGEDLGVPKPMPIAFGRLVGDEDLVADLGQAVVLE